MSQFTEAREQMVDLQIAGRGISHPRLLAAMRAVPREKFVEPGFEQLAYSDSPLPIGEGQTISQPYIVALMIAASELKPGERVLEVGAGSGYAAAVMAEIAGTVHAIERHAALGRQATERLERLGYRNIALRIGDGTRGWPEAAPFDVILVSAGGPEPPEALKRQLAIGGRLIVPVGPGQRQQQLVKIVRTAEDRFDEENLGEVRFVPLIGAEGWAEHGGGSAASNVPARPSSAAQMIAAAAEPLPPIDDPAFGRLIDRFADRRVVLLGEASHGTSEFYRARAAITRRLIEEHGFTIVAVEADWPDAAAIDRHVRHLAPRPGAELPFQRFPSWMWRNAEVAEFVAWLREHNGAIAEQRRRAGFYGLDIYNLRASIAAVLHYLDSVDPQAAAVARERYACLTPWQNDPATYGRAVLTSGYRTCEAAVVEQCRTLLEKQLQYSSQDGDSFLDAAQNARLIASAERYFRVMYYGGEQSWNLRDTHMFETLRNLVEARGPDAKAVVWAHNSHIGDARFTEMGGLREQLNIGQLCREQWGGEVALVGFATHCGTVAAASDWDGAMEVMLVRPSRADSYERLCHDSAIPCFLLDLRPGVNDPLRQSLEAPLLERFIGVIYRPESERMSHYSQVSLPGQFDALIWFDQTSAVTPLGTEQHAPGMPETYPFGL